MRYHVYWPTSADVSEKHTALIFRVKNWTKKAAGRMLFSGYLLGLTLRLWWWRYRVLRNVGMLSAGYHSSPSKRWHYSNSSSWKRRTFVIINAFWDVIPGVWYTDTNIAVTIYSSRLQGQAVSVLRRVGTHETTLSQDRELQLWIIALMHISSSIQMIYCYENLNNFRTPNDTTFP
jgi:hypothetical protein